MEFNDYTLEASSLLDKVENYQFELGKISNAVMEKYGFASLQEFSKEIQSQCGIKRTASTLYMYGYVYKKSQELGLPKDILFSGCQAIIFSDDPPKYAKMAQDGFSGYEIKKTIEEDEG